MQWIAQESCGIWADSQEFWLSGGGGVICTIHRDPICCIGRATSHSQRKGRMRSHPGREAPTGETGRGKPPTETGVIADVRKQLLVGWGGGCGGLQVLMCAKNGLRRLPWMSLAHCADARPSKAGELHSGIRLRSHPCPANSRPSVKQQKGRRKECGGGNKRWRRGREADAPYRC